MRRVVITGMGAVTPVGNNVNDMWEAVKAGKCGIGKITHFNTENSAVKLAGEVKGFDAESILDKAELRKMDDFTIYALAAAHEAVKDSAIDFGKEDTLRCGVILGPRMQALAQNQKRFLKELLFLLSVSIIIRKDKLCCLLVWRSTEDAGGKTNGEFRCFAQAAGHHKH